MAHLGAAVLLLLAGSSANAALLKWCLAERAECGPGQFWHERLVLRVGPSKAMCVAFLSPVFGMLWGALVLGEQVTPESLRGEL